MRERFARAGAGNAVWVWNPTAAYGGSTPLSGLFPGPRDVDWLAVDGYNWGSAPGAGKPTWVTNTLRSARSSGVSAVVWFEFDKETDWRLAGDPASAAAARTVLRCGGWRLGGDLRAVERLVVRRPT